MVCNNKATLKYRIMLQQIIEAGHVFQVTLSEIEANKINDYPGKSCSFEVNCFLQLNTEIICR